MTTHDDSPLMALEAEIIFATASRGISWESVLDMELWQIAAALGMHRVETRAERDSREITETKKAYWEETGEQRMQRVAGYSERRRQAKLARQAEKRKQRGEKADAR